jgi:hypothetical protein
VVKDRRWSFVGGIERAFRATVPRSGATCLVGSGDGIRGRRLATGAALGWVALAGVEVRARLIGVRAFVVARLETRAVFLDVTARFLLATLRFLLVVGRLRLVAVRVLLVAVRFLVFTVRFLLDAERLAALRVLGFAVVLRAVERTEPLVFFRDAAAFNCFPLFGLWPRPSSRTPRNFPGPPYIHGF